MNSIFIEEFQTLEKFTCELCNGVALVTSGDHPAGWALGLNGRTTRCTECKKLPEYTGVDIASFEGTD